MFNNINNKKSSLALEELKQKLRLYWNHTKYKLKEEYENKNTANFQFFNIIKNSIIEFFKDPEFQNIRIFIKNYFLIKKKTFIFLISILSYLLLNINYYKNLTRKNFNLDNKLTKIDNKFKIDIHSFEGITKNKKIFAQAQVNNLLKKKEILIALSSFPIKHNSFFILENFDHFWFPIIKEKYNQYLVGKNRIISKNKKLNFLSKLKLKNYVNNKKIIKEVDKKKEEFIEKNIENQKNKNKSKLGVWTPLFIEKDKPSFIEITKKLSNKSKKKLYNRKRYIFFYNNKISINIEDPLFIYYISNFKESILNLKQTAFLYKKASIYKKENWDIIKLAQNCLHFAQKNNTKIFWLNNFALSEVKIRYNLLKIKHDRFFNNLKILLKINSFSKDLLLAYTSKKVHFTFSSKWFLQKSQNKVSILKSKLKTVKNLKKSRKKNRKLYAFKNDLIKNLKHNLMKKSLYKLSNEARNYMYDKTLLKAESIYYSRIFNLSIDLFKKDLLRSYYKSGIKRIIKNNQIKFYYFYRSIKTFLKKNFYTSFSKKERINYSFKSTTPIFCIYLDKNHDIITPTIFNLNKIPLLKNIFNLNKNISKKGALYIINSKWILFNNVINARFRFRPSIRFQEHFKFILKKKKNFSRFNLNRPLKKKRFAKLKYILNKNITKRSLKKRKKRRFKYKHIKSPVFLTSLQWRIICSSLKKNKEKRYKRIPPFIKIPRNKYKNLIYNKTSPYINPNLINYNIYINNFIFYKKFNFHLKKTTYYRLKNLKRKNSLIVKLNSLIKIIFNKEKIYPYYLFLLNIIQKYDNISKTKMLLISLNLFLIELILFIFMFYIIKLIIYNLFLVISNILGFWTILLKINRSKVPFIFRRNRPDLFPIKETDWKFFSNSNYSFKNFLEGDVLEVKFSSYVMLLKYSKEKIGIPFLLEKRLDANLLISKLKNYSNFLNINIKASKKKSLFEPFLLIGPPGTGKTLLVKAIAGEADVPVILFLSDKDKNYIKSIRQKRPDHEKLRFAFFHAKLAAPSILYLDEMEALAPKRRITYFAGQNLWADIEINEKSRPYFFKALKGPSLKETDKEFVDRTGIVVRSRSSLLQLLVECNLLNYEKSQPLLLIGATNYLQEIDEALLRPGRFEKIYKFSLPNKDKRIALCHFYNYGLKMEKNIPWNYIAKRAKNFSSADISLIMLESSIYALANKKIHTLESLDVSINRRLGILKNHWTLENNKNEKTYTKAIHLAYYKTGLMLLSLFLKEEIPAYIKIWPITELIRVKQKKIDEYTEFNSDQTLKNFEQKLILAYGGKACEFLLANKDKDTIILDEVSEDFTIGQIYATFISNYFNLYSRSTSISNTPPLIPLTLKTFWNMYYNNISKLNKKLEGPSFIYEKPKYGLYGLEVAENLNTSKKEKDIINNKQNNASLFWWYKYASIDIFNKWAYGREKRKWARLWLRDPLISFFQEQYVYPDIFVMEFMSNLNYNYNFTNQGLRKLNKKMRLIWPKILEKKHEYFITSLIFNSLQIAMTILNKHREFVDTCVQHLIIHNVLRESDILNNLVSFKLQKLYSKELNKDDNKIKDLKILNNIETFSKSGGFFSKRSKNLWIDVKKINYEK